ncbi:hypothetical protein [Larkinella punicea]|uniref:hypothetical protein n=1 Tax=Larkinella punicea TaxID=2315727 RepID=UPI001058B363|nr:hypothetical protein [Larkinella punicea]
MKKLKLVSSKRLQVGLLATILVFSTAQATYAKFIGWENDNGGGYAVSCGGGAYTVNFETYYFCGVAVDHREVWRDGNNSVLSGNPCQ